MFKNMKIGMKLGLGLGFVLTLLIISSIIAFSALNTAASGFSEYRSLAVNTVNAGRVQANFLLVRLAALSYIGNGSADNLKAQTERINSLSKITEEAISKSVSEEQENTFKKIKKDVEVYDRAFGEVVSKIKKRDELVKGVLDVIGPEMEKDLSKILLNAKKDNHMEVTYYASKAVRSLLLARLYSAKFLVNNTTEEADRVEKEYKAFKNDLNNLDSKIKDRNRRSLFSKVDDKKDKYINTFRDVVSLILERNKIKTEKLDVIGVSASETVEDLKLSIKKQQDIIGPQLVDSNERSITFLIIMSLIAVLIGVAVAIVVTRLITGPIGEAVKIANELASGHLNDNIKITNNDETGELLRAFKEMITRLITIISQVRASADNLSAASEEMSSTAQSISQSASEQASSVEETSAAMEEMNASINQNNENSKVTDGIANKSAQEAMEGGQAVSRTVDAMRQIADKISIIDEIAYQTNLLALNAAIEAGRAGEHGRGFAVVAAEVRKLAARSQTAAKEIGEVATNSVDLAEQAGKLLESIVPSIQKTAELVQEISAASSEQSTGANEINGAISQITQATQQNASASEELSSTAEELTSQAVDLQEMMAFFKVHNQANVSHRPSRAKTTPQMKTVNPQKEPDVSPTSVESEDFDFEKF